MNLDKYRATIGVERLKSFGYGMENVTEEYLAKMDRFDI